MAKKQRVLESLRMVESELRKAAKTGSKKNAVNIRENLTALRDVCYAGLSENSYAKYGEIYDGLILAVEQMTKVKELRLNEEAFSLSMDLLQYLIRITEEETSFKKDIVFLPYKASMWDSLESVWKAAAEDEEHCNAYVIPIPYSDLNPDGSVARWHCERADYPVYVPTLDWRSVDLKELHPDVIFIHNPYDDENRVTSVETRFYSKNLRECTDKLVYIPYYISEEPSSVNSAEGNARKSFILEPGVMNADLVVVQSEAIRQIFINVLARGTNVTDRAYWEKRIVGLGSPKIDKVLTSKKEDFVMPKKWKQLVKRKKVILYITSVSPALQNSDKVCDKLRYVFDVFRNRDDVVLWWRPHPLMKATLHSMRPEVEKEYLKIEKQYIEEGWGIYDDTSDLHRAICWSDAYYGDYSSVMTLYRATGKPVMLQNMSVDSENSAISCMDILEQGDKIYALERNGSLLELTNRNFVSFLGNINETLNDVYLKMHMLKNNQLVFVPFYRKYIVRYDTQYANFSVLLNLEDENMIKRMPYNHAFEYKGKVFFFGLGDYASILIWDECVKEYRIDDRWMEKFEKTYGIRTTQYYPYDACRIEQFVWLTLKEKNKLMKYDMDTGESEFYEIGSSPNSFVTICYDGENFWLTGDAEEIVSWNPISKSTRVFKTFPSGFKKRIFQHSAWNGWEYLFNQSVKRGEYIFFSPQRANMLIAVNTKTGEIVKIKDISDETFCFPMVKMSDNRIFFQEKGYQWECANEYEIDVLNQCKESFLTSNKTLTMKNVFFSSVGEFHRDVLKTFIEEIPDKSDQEKILLKIDEEIRKTKVKWGNFIREQISVK